ncbi:hypothetical protein B6U98_00220 [Thermoplasmatales archaeon ex4572_165]|nr:MAG: hypothetical protein B6U98_00220 [Thermoplasmatales archaeon ex4572_165]
MNKIFNSKIQAAIIITAIVMIGSIMLNQDNVKAGSYNGEDLALAILANESWLIDSSYFDTDESGTSQSIILSSLGPMTPTDGSTFVLFSSGVAGATPATTNEGNPGDERGSWFSGGKYGMPRDQATLTMTLQVPDGMRYLYYDVQFLSTEYPEWVGTQYNDKLTITVDSPSNGVTSYIFDINSGYFVFVDELLPEVAGTGYNVYATQGSSGGVDWVDTTYRSGKADAGASSLTRIGGTTHPVSPLEQITVTIDIHDTGDNILDSTAFIDNIMFSGYSKANIVARKTVQDLNDADVEPNDILQYTVTISNTGNWLQRDNDGHEFEDNIPLNTTYVGGSASASSGTIQYLSNENKIVWDGSINSESSISLSFEVRVNDSLPNGSLIRNQGVVYWDSDGSYPYNNDAVELTDDPYSDDGIDQDNDSDTNDDDPTDLYVVSFETPAQVTESFSDDENGGSATESYMDRNWFSTSSESGESNFEVVDGYYDDTPKSFKTKIRAAGSPQYWYYNLTNLEGVLTSWQINFKCGNATESSELVLDFTNSEDESIAKLMFAYIKQGTNPPVDWVVKLYYWSPSSASWLQLETSTGYLYNHWYTLNIDILDAFHLRYSLYVKGLGLVDTKDDLSMDELITSYIPGSQQSNLAYIKWETSMNPIVCPMFFWDEHIIELS